MKITSKRNRHFSTAFKKEKVELLDQKKISVKELSDIYEVSCRAIYSWKHKYSKFEKEERIVVEKISEESKNITLLKQIAELERVVGKKQLEIDYYRTTIEVINDQYGEDIEKKYKPK